VVALFFFLEADDDEPWWIVFFAPSAAAHALPALRVHFSMAPGEPWRGGRLHRARVAAIGPTTGDYLRDKVGLFVEVVADVPTADTLTAALVNKNKEKKTL